MIQLSGKQCKTARLLLKWNLRELSYRSGVKAGSLELFETGTKQLYMTDKESLGKIFRKEGVVFLDFGEVQLEDGGKSVVQMPNGGGYDTGEQVTYYAEDAESALYDDNGDLKPEAGNLKPMPGS